MKNANPEIIESLSSKLVILPDGRNIFLWDSLDESSSEEHYSKQGQIQNSPNIKLNISISEKKISTSSIVEGTYIVSPLRQKDKHKLSIEKNNFSAEQNQLRFKEKLTGVIECKDNNFENKE